MYILPMKIALPGDKSLTHRALLLGALASGTSVIEEPLSSLDVRTTAGVLRRLGVSVSPMRGGRVEVEGVGLRGLRQPAATLHCGNSGTAARLLLGVLAGTAPPFTARLTGDASLRRRPMRRVTAPLSSMGASFVEQAGDGLPLRVEGRRLHSIVYEQEVASAQVKSAILLAALVAGVEVTVREPLATRDHSERMLRALGVPVASSAETVTLSPVESIESFSMHVPGDPSSAAFLAGAALLSGHDEIHLSRVAVNPTRMGFFDAIGRMGARVEIGDVTECMGEPVADVAVRTSPLGGTIVTREAVPTLIDEIPMLAAVASMAEGTTTFQGVAELRVKESDRLALLAANLRAVGKRCLVNGDTLTVEGSPQAPAGAVDTGLDHRMAMTFAVMGRIPGASVRLSETESPEISYPGFFADLGKVAPHG
jgi:3-phosphoshikimate 1-carboxyvinyltransferase